MPARALSGHRQARFAYRLHARLKDEKGPEEILEREGAALATRLWAAAALATRLGRQQPSDPEIRLRLRSGGATNSSQVG